MPWRSFSHRLLLLCLLVLSGCFSGCFSHQDKAANLSPDLIGVWLRPIEGLPGVEGYQFESDGTVRFVNMFTIEGVRWEMVDDNVVRIWSATERYPEPESVDLQLVSVTATELRLRRAMVEDAVEQVYTREADAWVGRWTGPDGNFVDVAVAEDEWRVTSRLGQDFNTEPGRRVGDDLIVGIGLGTTRLKRKGPGCLRWADHGEFCRQLEVK